MMTLEAFAAMAHSFPESTQSSHFGTTDFRVSNKSSPPCVRKNCAGF